MSVLGLIVRRSLRQHALSTIVTSLSLALGGGLLMAVWEVRTQSHATFTQIDGGFDAVLGARSSKLQLVLNAVFHLEASPANITLADYDEIRTNPLVALAVPLAMGDNFRGYRVVGTTPELFTATEYAPGNHYQVRSPGRIFDPQFKEALVGSFAARQLGLRRGDTFRPYHGLHGNKEEEHEETYTVVGVLEPSNTPADRVLWIPLEGVQTMEGHAETAAHEISAVLVKLRTDIAGQALDMSYNKKGTRLTWAWPIGATMAELMKRIGWFDLVLQAVAALVGVVAAGSILASMYNSMNERQRQLAILRALGARRRTVFSVLLLEAAAIAMLGACLSFIFYAVIMAGTGHFIRAETGVVLEVVRWDPVFLWAPAAMLGLSLLAGLIPAIKGYRIDVAENLQP